MWEEDDDWGFNNFPEEEEEKGCQICGKEDDSIMCCASCSLDRTCGDCRAVTDCASYCKACVGRLKDDE
ncbi:hypothetical protein N9948_00800 [bacterium]|nr:hypothetical protein [bacterium]